MGHPLPHNSKTLKKINSKTHVTEVISVTDIGFITITGSNPVVA